MDEDGILLSGATARRHSQPGWLGWTLKDGSGLWQCEVDFRTVRAWRGIERPRHTLCETRLLCRCQLCVEKLALRLGRSRRSRAFVHSLRNSCAFAACVRPLHTSMFILLRGFCAGWSPRSLQDVRLGDAERVIVLSERTPSFLKGHRDLAAKEHYTKNIPKTPLHNTIDDSN